MLSTPASVPAGTAQLVLEVAGSAPTDLQQFVGADVAFTVGDELHYLVQGCGRAVEDVATVHEKDPNTGKDVRVWEVTERNGRFFAETDPMF